MKYLLLMYANETVAQEAAAADYQATAQAWQSVLQEMKSAGVWLGNNGLCNVSDATTVRLRDDNALLTDGPFAETHEQLGGYYLIDCADLDEAIAWAKKIPVAKYGAVEIRPLNQWSQAA